MRGTDWIGNGQEGKAESTNGESNSDGDRQEEKESKLLGLRGQSGGRSGQVSSQGRASRLATKV